MTDGSQPDVSIIIYAGNAVAPARRALESVLGQEGIADAEVFLADGSGLPEMEELARSLPEVRHLVVPPGPMPVVKGAAMAAARGALVAVLDPADEAEPGWLAGLQTAMKNGAAAAGGGVLLHPECSVSDQAAYLFEYGAFVPPLADGPTHGDLPGNNVVYRRQALQDWCGDLLAGGFWKPFFHQRIRGQGGVLLLTGAMVVRHRTSYRAGAVLRRFYHFGRCFGGMRPAHATPGRNLMFRLLGPLVPLVLSARHLSRAAGHPASRRLLPGAGAMLVAICWAWGVGECLGYWLGPGASCRRVT